MGTAQGVPASPIPFPDGKEGTPQQILQRALAMLSVVGTRLAAAVSCPGCRVPCFGSPMAAASSPVHTQGGRGGAGGAAAGPGHPPPPPALPLVCICLFFN